METSFSLHGETDADADNNNDNGDVPAIHHPSDVYFSQIKYRAEIDGLRAVAVTPVVLYHFEAGFQGGYAGIKYKKEEEKEVYQKDTIFCDSLRVDAPRQSTR